MKLWICVLVVIGGFATVLVSGRRSAAPVAPHAQVLSGVVKNKAHPRERAAIQVGLVEFGSAADHLHDALWEQCIASTDPNCFPEAAWRTLSSGLAGLTLTKPNAKGRFTLKPSGAESYLVVSGRDSQGWLWCPSSDVSGFVDVPEPTNLEIPCHGMGE